MNKQIFAMTQLLFFFLMCVGINASLTAQVNFPPGLRYLPNSEFNEAVDLLKINKLHVVLPRKTSAFNEQYIKVFTDYWKFSELDFVSDEGAKEIQNPLGFYFGLGSLDTKTTWTTKRSDGSHYSTDFTNTDIYYSLYNIYTYTYEKTIDTSTRTLSYYHLYTDFGTLMQPSNLTDEDFSFGGRARNWSLGFLKNSLQYLQTNLAHPENMVQNKKNSIKGKHPMLKNLKTDTLFVPDYVFINFNYLTGNESKKIPVKNLFHGYEFPYKVISMQDLSEKIMMANKPLYYLHYVKSSSSTSSCIINGLTGEILFSVSDLYYSYNLKPKEISRMSNLIRKSK